MDSSHSLISVNRVEGAPVFDKDGERLGHVEEIMLDKVSGKVAYALMSYGGVMGKRHYPLPFVELTGSVLILINRWVWLGAGMLGAFTAIGAVTAHAFWKVSGPARKDAIAVFLMHFGLIAAFALDALLAESLGR